jgi:hypothetical protein
MFKCKSSTVFIPSLLKALRKNLNSEHTWDFNLVLLFTLHQHSTLCWFIVNHNDSPSTNTLHSVVLLLTTMTTLSQINFWSHKLYQSLTSLLGSFTSFITCTQGQANKLSLIFYKFISTAADIGNVEFFKSPLLDNIPSASATVQNSKCLSYFFFHRWFTVPNAQETLSFQPTLSFGNCWKPAEAKSIEYSGWSIEEMLFPAKNCNTQIKEYAGTAQWWRINTQSLHNYPCLCLTINKHFQHFHVECQNFTLSVPLKAPFSYLDKADDTQWSNKLLFNKYWEQFIQIFHMSSAFLHDLTFQVTVLPNHPVRS